MPGTYDDPKWGVIQEMVLGKAADAAIGSANAARAVLQQITLLKNITVKDLNLEVKTGATCTGTGGVTTEVYTLKVGKVLGGTASTAIAFGTLSVGTAGQANASILDGSLTETNLVAGDDIQFFAEIGTALGDNSLVAKAHLSYVEHYVSS